MPFAIRGFRRKGVSQSGFRRACVLPRGAVVNPDVSTDNDLGPTIFRLERGPMRNVPRWPSAGSALLARCSLSIFLAATPLLAVATPPDPLPGVGHPGFLSPHFEPLAIVGGHLFVANTPADTVDVVDVAARRVVRRIPVGIQPVSVVARPDGREVWVANHVSDSVSVIDTAPQSATRFHVVATIQDLDPLTLATRFDEPVGIAFADDSKAYVALSSENRIAVIDVAARRVARSLPIPAQDPRAIQVRDGRLYVAPFESHNRTQLSGGRGNPDGDLVTFDAWEHSIRHNNVLSIGHVVDVVKHPDVPDRDLFVFDTATDELLETVEGLGTLLYGISIDAGGRVFLAQTDARNDANGRAGTKHQGLAELDNRPFLNRITSVLPGSGQQPTFYDLEPLPPAQPAAGEALATPFALRVSGDGRTIVATAAGSGMLFTLDVASGAVLGRVKVGAWPDGLALECGPDGAPVRAWVLAAFSDDVTLVDLVDRDNPATLSTISLADPTPDLVRRGKIAFHTAAASTSNTFSCASCHPDGHTDQLLWVLATPVVSGGEQIMPRSTMPCRGLRDTSPFHWDGIPGDPYGGINSASVHADVAANSDPRDATSPVRHLIDGGLASTMRLAGDQAANDEGKPGALTAAERDALAAFLLDIPYPPSQRRSATNIVSERARSGFRLFHVEGDLDPSKPAANVCGDCHRMPHLVSTNTPGSGMDAPTWRGAYDRWLILPQGRLNIIDFDFFRDIAHRGTPERDVWRMSWGGRERFDPVWEMVLEGSTGFAGAFGRQMTLNRETSAPNQRLTRDLLAALEAAASDGTVLLRGEGVFTSGDRAGEVMIEFDAAKGVSAYVTPDGSGRRWSRDDLLAAAATGSFVGTFTARLGTRSSHPQPTLWTEGEIQSQRGHQEFPRLLPGERRMTMGGRHVDPGAFPLLDGRRAEGTVRVDGETIVVELATPPADGMHLLQVQNPGGLVSNDFLFFVNEEPQSPVDTKGKTLAEILALRKWDRLPGTWVDEATGGKIVHTTYAWKIPDRVLEEVNTGGDNPSTSLLAVNAADGTIFQVGGDSRGATFAGAWTSGDDGAAATRLAITNADGDRFDLAIRHRFTGPDTMTLTIELPQPISIDLVRAKE